MVAAVPEFVFLLSCPCLGADENQPTEPLLPPKPTALRNDSEPKSKMTTPKAFTDQRLTPQEKMANDLAEANKKNRDYALQISQLTTKLRKAEEDRNLAQNSLKEFEGASANDSNDDTMIKLGSRLLWIDPAAIWVVAVVSQGLSEKIGCSLQCNNVEVAKGPQAEMRVLADQILARKRASLPPPSSDKSPSNPGRSEDVPT